MYNIPDDVRQPGVVTGERLMEDEDVAIVDWEKRIVIVCILMYLSEWRSTKHFPPTDFKSY